MRDRERLGFTSESRWSGIGVYRMRGKKLDVSVNNHNL